LNCKTRIGYLGEIASKNTVRFPPFLLTSVHELNDVLDDMMYLTALGQPILFLNSLKVAAELLDRRASIYSGRPRLIMAQEIISGNLRYFPFSAM
jgi:hypothetical protein